MSNFLKFVKRVWFFGMVFFLFTGSVWAELSYDDAGRPVDESGRPLTSWTVGSGSISRDDVANILKRGDYLQGDSILDNNLRELAISVYQDSLNNYSSQSQFPDVDSINAHANAWSDVKKALSVVDKNNPDIKNKSGSWSKGANGKWVFLSKADGSGKEIPYRTLHSSYYKDSGSQTVSCGKEGLEGVDFLFFKGPLVPCGINKKCADSPSTTLNKPCTMCHFIILIKNFFDLLLSLLVVVSILMLTVAGVIYIISAGSGLTGLAKEIIQKTLLGFGLFLLSWLIVYTLLNLLSVKTEMIGKGGDSWFKFECDTESSFDFDEGRGGDFGGGGSSGNATEGGQSKDVDGWATTANTEKSLREKVNDSGVMLAYSPCYGTGSGVKTGCVSLIGATEKTMSGIKETVSGCKSFDSNCEVVLTSVTDRIINPNNGKTYFNRVHAGDESCSYCHHSGDKVDYRANDTFNRYLTGKGSRDEISRIPIGETEGILTRIGTRRGSHGGPKFKDPDGNIWVYEAGGANGHWDVCYAGASCPENN